MGVGGGGAEGTPHGTEWAKVGTAAQADTRDHCGSRTSQAGEAVFLSGPRWSAMASGQPETSVPTGRCGASRARAFGQAAAQLERNAILNLRHSWQDGSVDKGACGQD